MPLDPRIATMIGSAAQAGGLAQRYPGLMERMALVESNGNPSARNPSGASGLYQFVPKTAAAYGLSDPFDAQASANAAARLTLDNEASLRRSLGRDPTAGELYLAHQQGAGGASKLLSNPDASAASLVGASAVTGNGGKADETAAQFAGRWTGRFDGQPMAIPGEAPTPGAFGLSGPTQVGAPFSLAPAGAAAMTAPTEPAPADDGPDFAALLKSLGGLSGTGQTAQGQGQQQGDTPIQPLPTRQPRAAQFDPTKFFALLPGRRAPV